jgi:uncharacterized membrane protein YgcG
MGFWLKLFGKKKEEAPVAAPLPYPYSSYMSSAHVPALNAAKVTHHSNYEAKPKSYSFDNSSDDSSSLLNTVVTGEVLSDVFSSSSDSSSFSSDYGSSSFDSGSSSSDFSGFDGGSSGGGGADF